MENVIIAQNSGESLTNASSATAVNSEESHQASSGLQLPLRRQRDAPQDLDIVSWPPNKRIPLFSKMPWYTYNVGSGIDTYIYIIDNGINRDNAVRIQSVLRLSFSL